jgi:hypothetical protein
MHIKSFYTQQHCYISILKTLYPDGIRTRVFSFLRWMWCSLRHAARAKSWRFQSKSKMSKDKMSTLFDILKSTIWISAFCIPTLHTSSRKKYYPTDWKVWQKLNKKVTKSLNMPKLCWKLSDRKTALDIHNSLISVNFMIALDGLNLMLAFPCLKMALLCIFSQPDQCLCQCFWLNIFK